MTALALKMRRSVDLGIMLAYLLFALFLYSGQWLSLKSGYLLDSAADQHLWEWFFDVAAHNVIHLQNPLFSDLQNYPLGVNMMANTAMLGLGIPLTPVTLIFGPTVTWAIALTGGLAGSAAAWYWVFSRYLVTSKGAAAIGGAFCGFAPSIISHGNAHPNFVAWFVLPFIVLKVIQIARNERPVRNGIILGLLTAFQIFLGEEPLFITGVTFVVFALAYVLSRPRDLIPMLRPLGKGIGIGLAIMLAAVVFPLWWQFFGPQSYEALEHGSVGNDTAALTRFATRSLAGDPGAAADVSLNRTEENAFFGWSLIIFMIVVAVWLWRDRLARSLAIAMVVLAWLSLGAEIVVAHEATGIPGPWKLLSELPLFESVLESRFAMGCVPLIGALLALATARVFAAAAQQDALRASSLPGESLPQSARLPARLPLRWLWLGVLVAILLPLAPTRFIVEDRPATPRFFTEGTWRQFVDPGGTITPVPLPSGGESAPLRWQMDSGLNFSMSEGYFVGPSGPDDRRGRYGAVSRPTSILFDQVKRLSSAVPVDDRIRAAALADFRYWRTDVVVLAPRPFEGAFRTTMDLLVGRPGEFIDGVWVWDVRDLTP